MSKRILLNTMWIFYLAMGCSQESLANSANYHGSGGVGLANIGGIHYLNLGTVTDQFNIQNSIKTAAVWGYGIGYQWDNLSNNLPISFGLDVTGYYMQYKFSGVQTPAINSRESGQNLSISTTGQ